MNVNRTETRPPVLMIAYACNPEGGGEHWLGWGWAEQAATFCNVHLITTPNSRAQVERHAPRHGITPHFVSVPNWVRTSSSKLGGAGGWLRKIAWQFRVCKLARSLHAREQFRLVHQTTFHTFRVPFLTARLGIPAVWGPIAGGESVPPGFARDLGAAWFGEAARGMVNRLWLWCPQVRASLRHARVIFVSNRTTLDFLPAVFRDKCVVVPPNALRVEDESSLFSSSSFSSSKPAKEKAGTETFHLLYVGNCVASRALPLVFAALQHSGLEECRLTVVGGGSALGRWQRRAIRMGLAGRATFTGPVPRAELAAQYARASALVFPALRDSGGSALLEAMACGVPVVCLDWGGPGEMVDANSGVKIPVRDRDEAIAALAAAIARLKELPELRSNLARSGRERALRQFRWEAKKALLFSTYQRLLSPP